MWRIRIKKLGISLILKVFSNVSMFLKRFYMKQYKELQLELGISLMQWSPLVTLCVAPGAAPAAGDRR